MDSEYPRTAVPPDATFRNAFNHFGLQCLGPVLILCLVILRQVKTSPVIVDIFRPEGELEIVTVK
jgi:hypothetical protein